MASILNQSITAAGQDVDLNVASDGSIFVQIEGGPFVADLQFFATIDGTNFFEWYGASNASLNSVDSVSGPDQLIFTAGGIQTFRVHCSSLTSGTPVISIASNPSFSGNISAFATPANTGGSFPVAGTVFANQGGTWNVRLQDSSGNSINSNAGRLDTFSTLAASTANIGVVTQGLNGAGGIPWKVDGSSVTQPISGFVSVSNFPASQAVTGTFFQATQPVSAASLPLPSGAATSANQSSEIASLSSIDGKLSSSIHGLQVDGSAVTQPISGSVSVSNFPSTQNVSSLDGSVASLGSSSGKSVVMKTGSITSTANTADQVVLSYTVTGGKTLYLQYLSMEGRLTSLSSTGSILGKISVENPSGTKDITHNFVNSTNESVDKASYSFAEPLPIAGGSVIRVVCTPNSATSMLWQANFGGYEK